jgi:hypothetical protein
MQLARYGSTDMSTQQQTVAGLGARIMRWAEEVATISEEASALTRL